MADTIQTPDGKNHVLLCAEDLCDIVTEYAGKDADREFRRLQQVIADEEYRAYSDLECYEASLEDNARCFSDIMDVLQSMSRSIEPVKLTKTEMKHHFDQTTKAIVHLINQQI